MNKKTKRARANMIKGIIADYKICINEREVPLSRSLNLVNHSPTGFSWGYGGSGPAQTALAILLEVTNKKTALSLYQDFKWDVIAKLPKTDFKLPISQVKKWLKKVKITKLHLL